MTIPRYWTITVAMLRPWRFALTVLVLLQGIPCLAEPPPGPDGMAYDPRLPKFRYPTLRPGYWKLTRDAKRVENCGNQMPTAAETAAAQQTLQRLKSIILDTPTASKPIGFYGHLDANMFCELGSPLPGVSERALPIRNSVAFYTFDLAEFKSGDSWQPWEQGEAPGLYIDANFFESLPEFTGRRFAMERPTGRDRGRQETHLIYLREEPSGTFRGLPFYQEDANLVIARPGRDPWRPATIGQVMPILLDRDRGRRPRPGPTEIRRHERAGTAATGVCVDRQTRWTWRTRVAILGPNRPGWERWLQGAAGP